MIYRSRDQACSVCDGSGLDPEHEAWYECCWLCWGTGETEVFEYVEEGPEQGPQAEVSDTPNP